MNILETINKVEALLNENHISAEVEQFEDIPAYTVHIEWGDWKHEHLRAKWLIENANLGKFVRSETTDEDGSDCYSATHYFVA